MILIPTALRVRLRRSRRLVEVVRAIRGRLDGGAHKRSERRPAEIEDRIRERIQARLEPLPDGEARLTLLLPTLDARRTFAGVRSALDLFEAVGVHAARRRIVTFAPLPATLDSSFSSGAADGRPATQVISLAEDPQRVLDVGPSDRFIATFWSTAELARRILAWQDATFGTAPRCFCYLIQDFEPGFYPWSAQWLLARSTYDDPIRTVAVFNTALLQSYFHDEGIKFEHEFAFEPALWAGLRDTAPGAPPDRERRIVVYGRPSTPRNAFPLIVEGLREWIARDPSALGWSIVSAGERHRPIDLGHGMTLESVGKLDLDAYARLLRSSLIGISLMVSPHPSFPPLEMANLGLRVLTNRFATKDLASWHANLESLDDISPEGLARSLAGLARRLEVDPALGARGVSTGPGMLREEPTFPFTASLAGLLGIGDA